MGMFTTDHTALYSHSSISDSCYWICYYIIYHRSTFLPARFFNTRK
jgi:hypothetical protein